MKTYGLKPDNKGLMRMYHGVDLDKQPQIFNHIIFSNGNLDPWSVGGFLKPFTTKSLHVLIVIEGAHH
jgi:hypothetical protein